MINQYFFYFLYLIFSYLLGSIPFAYIISRLASGKNILEIGWKKSSSSNVVKNVGKWPGILTFFLDVGKGFLVVFLAQKYNLPIAIQVLAGFMAIIGHNWSIFLKFNGGRGLGTLIGAIFAFSPPTLFILLIPTIVFTLIWTASIGTILSLIFGIFFTFKGGLNYFEPIGWLIILSLVPIFIKRLSPIEEIIKSNNKKELIENRLIFDQDTVPPFRIKLFKKQ